MAEIVDLNLRVVGDRTNVHPFKTSQVCFKEHFRRLVENGHLAMHGKTRGAWYTLR